jgi:sporulation protein YlmC with PRC-barrel domain
MAAFDPATLDRWRALAIVDRDGTTVGTISEFYLDRETGHPTWAVVETGLFGATQTFVPLVNATEIEDGLQVPYEKRHIKDSPRVDPHDELTPDEEARLFAHYGVDYEPAAGPEGETPEGPGPVPVDAATEQEVEAAPDASATVEEPAPVPAEPGTAEGPEPVPGEPGTTEGPGPVPEEPGTNAGPGPVPEEPGTREGPETAAGPDDATLIAPGEFGSASDHPDDAPDPDLSRTAPVEPGLPGSTAASPGPIPTTVDKDADDLASHPIDEPFRDRHDSPWTSAAAGSFDERPVERPAGASDRWREAKLAAERERIAREAAQPEERSPLERARRRLERLVGVGQDHSDDDIASTDQEAAERARRARLGFDDDDPRLR